MDRVMTVATLKRAGLLHTVPALAASFDTALAASSPGIDLVQIVDPSLLADAIRGGVTPDVTERVARHIGYLVDAGAQAILVTCSSIGEAVEAAAADRDLPVLRVDAPMASEAVGLALDAGRAAGRAGRIVVLATLEATLGPTGRLIAREAAGEDVHVDVRIVDGALNARTSGDQHTHDVLIREAISASASEADVIVLAQASMAGAMSGTHTPVPVLTSPEGGIAALTHSLDQRFTD
ncbi:MAG TPA: aspartate/glutamate racemase family protein [Glaciibacter sp.]|nr:aspartate/glutamate racemase family protein [Glaciibacter sp.]